ncbi:MAG: alcohol dehydrogenase catalytic domain-containing protein, partial [Thermoproteota archaeon]|nr:alcohol dehydrogenase catalytic domain-containing protein [Thermoproteota archaeon]
MKGAQIIKTKEPLQINDIDIPKPKDKEVLIKVNSAGICHSDLHFWEGGYAGREGVFMKVDDR